MAILIKICAKEWISLNSSQKRGFEKKAEIDKKRFKKQLIKDFEKLWYYKSNYKAEKSPKTDKESKEEKEEKVSIKKKKRSSSFNKKNQKGINVKV